METRLLKEAELGRLKSALLTWARFKTWKTRLTRCLTTWLLLQEMSSHLSRGVKLWSRRSGWLTTDPSLWIFKSRWKSSLKTESLRTIQAPLSVTERRITLKSKTKACLEALLRLKTTTEDATHLLTSPNLKTKEALSDLWWARKRRPKTLRVSENSAISPFKRQICETLSLLSWSSILDLTLRKRLLVKLSSLTLWLENLKRQFRKSSTRKNLLFHQHSWRKSVSVVKVQLTALSLALP